MFEKVLGGNSLPPAQVTARCASGYMLENPSIPHYLVTSERTFTMVTTCRARTISRKDWSDLAGFSVLWTEKDASPLASFDNQIERVEEATQPGIRCSTDSS
jgi:hypothetical protein